MNVGPNTVMNVGGNTAMNVGGNAATNIGRNATTIAGRNTTMKTGGNTAIDTRVPAYVDEVMNVVPGTIVETKRQRIENMEIDAQLFLKNLTHKLEEEKISPKNVYYSKNTNLRWEAFPKKLLERCTRKQNRKRMFVATNIKKCKNPRVLKLFVLFRSQSQVQMDHTIFIDWYNSHFKPTAKILHFPD
ncbi:uncharacterized protein LOC116425664 [Nomia melanderi]|uniref:uncharacterized protein LOC116425664 n=1 Tax=Nomia melanderi TaxID=2448451 RepID=UPI003FCD537F